MSTDGTTLCITATSTTATAFMSIARIMTVNVGANACAKLNLDTFEIAVAIDNSGSMANSARNGQTKMQAAIVAANQLVSAMNPAGQTYNYAGFAIVPFASTVNIGSGNATASFMDTQGASSIHWQNYLRPTGATVPTSRFDMFTSMNVAWGGCVEERPAPYTVSDDPASTSKPDTLYVPYLYPDENDTNKGSLNTYLPDTQSPYCAANDVYATADVASGTGDGQTKLCKYSDPKINTGSSGFGSAFPLGPNLLCSTKALTPMTATTSTVTAAINAMVAGGDTNLLTGVMWAWRTISPNGPFNAQSATPGSGPQNAKAYNYVATNKSSNHKILIILTDGMNHWYGQASDGTVTDPNKSSYSALGFFANNRLDSTSATNARGLMDAATLQACQNFVANNTDTNPAEIYTVGFTATDGIDADGQKLLAGCATQDGAHAFIAADGTQLVSVFAKIAASLTQPRVSK